MMRTERLFTKEELDILRACVGQVLKSFEAVVVARDNMAWQTVRLRFADVAVDISNKEETICIGEDFETDDVGVLQVKRASDEPLSIDEIEQPSCCYGVETRVCNVLCVENGVDIFDDGKLVNSRDYVQAVVMELDDGRSLVLDKQTWFGELLAFTLTDSWKAALRDESEDWLDDEDEPSTHFEFHSKAVSVL